MTQQAEQTQALTARIETLKRARGAVILAHYYTRPEVQAVADFLGDSLALSIRAQQVDAEVLLFAGVHFMAETAKVLCPGKRVLVPCPDAGCSLADSCDSATFAAFRAHHPDHVVVTYVNTSVGVKAQTDICCTSSNALQVVSSIPADRPVLFAPDRNLGSYIRARTGRTNMVLWDGACHVHERFTLERLRALRAAHPGAHVVAHPECRAEVVSAADFVGSTAAILDYCGTAPCDLFIVATEPGIVTEMERRYPTKRFLALPAADSATGCNECEYMKMVTLDRIAETLERMSPEVTIDEDVRQRAERSIRNMVAIR